MKTIKISYKINVPPKEVWQALVNSKLINAWGAGPAKMSDKQGAKFSLWDGSIYGKIIRVQKEKELVQEWYTDNWQEPSCAKFVLAENKRGLKTKTKGLGTTLKLTHENIPSNLYQELKLGWKHYFFSPLKLYLEDKHGNPDVEYHQGG